MAKLAGLQTDRINRAVRDIDPAGVETVRQFLRAMIDRDDPDKVLEAIFGTGNASQRNDRAEWQCSNDRRGHCAKPGATRPTTRRICCWSTTTAASAICCRASCAAKAIASPPR